MRNVGEWASQAVLNLPCDNSKSYVRDAEYVAAGIAGKGIQQRALFVGDDLNAFSSLLSFLGSKHWQISICRHAKFERRISTDPPLSVHLLVYCLNECEDLDTSVARLMQMRVDFPCTSIIVASTQFSGNDMSADRLAICDGSLKLPLAESDLFGALVSSLANNRVWQQRLRDWNDPESIC